MKYSFVTVAYAGDMGFMHLQARSMFRYVPRELIQEIIVVENTPPALPTQWRQRLRKEYGSLADLVKFLPSARIAKLPEGCAGWFSQQILKLMVAQHVTAHRYLILDAKNHFIFPLTRSDMERNGKPRMFTHGYLKHPLRRYLDPILKYFDLPATHNERFLPTTPPFYVDTALVRELIASMVQKENRAFADIFTKSTIRFTEFFLIGAYILSTERNFEDFYDLSGGGFSIIWPHYAPDEALVKQEIDNSMKRKAPLFSVHRGAFPVLSDRSKRAIVDLWVSRKLFEEHAAFSYLQDPNAGLL